MSKWTVLNCNYHQTDESGFRQRWNNCNLPEPWIAYPIHNPGNYGEWFATHAEAIAYADKQARRNA